MWNCTENGIKGINRQEAENSVIHSAINARKHEPYLCMEILISI